MLGVFNPAQFQHDVFQSAAGTAPLNIFQKCLFQPWVFQTDVCANTPPITGGRRPPKRLARQKEEEEMIMMIKNIAPYAFERLYRDEQ